MTTYRFGDRIPLSNGETVKLLDFHPTCGAFVEHAAPVQSCAHHDPSILLGMTTKTWVSCPAWRAALDRHGNKIGMVLV